MGPLLRLAADERARLIAIADELLSVLKAARGAESEGGEDGVVARWTARVAAVRENLDAVTEWDAAEGYGTGGESTLQTLRRLFPDGIADAELDTELRELMPALEEAQRRREERRAATPQPEVTEDGLDLMGHAARF